MVGVSTPANTVGLAGARYDAWVTDTVVGFPLLSAGASSSIGGSPSYEPALTRPDE
jgi:hypothetical protein